MNVREDARFSRIHICLSSLCILRKKLSLIEFILFVAAKGRLLICM